MKYKTPLSILTVLIAALAFAAALCGVWPGEGEPRSFPSLHGQTVTIYGKGLYQNDSLSVASQAVGQDIVTLALGIPLLLGALAAARRGSFRGRLLLTGCLGYFLYTYVSYSFLSAYNELFLLYVALMSLSFYAFVSSMRSFDMEGLAEHFDRALPVRLVGGLLIFIACILGLGWLNMILTPLLRGAVPVGLEHYSTLTIQALDLGFIVPASILSGILLIRRKPFGYLLSSVMIVKEASLLAAITAMMITQTLAGIQLGAPVIAAFSLFDAVIVFCSFLLFSHVKDSAQALHDNRKGRSEPL